MLMECFVSQEDAGSHLWISCTAVFEGCIKGRKGGEERAEVEIRFIECLVIMS